MVTPNRKKTLKETEKELTTILGKCNEHAIEY